MHYQSKQDQEMNDFNLHLPSTMQVLTFNTDYSYPLGKKTKLEAGYKSSYVNSTTRYDYTPIETQQPGAGEIEKFETDYLKVFPTLHLSYQLDSAGHNTLVFKANRRINRPNYQLMNPYILYADQYNYNQGNSLLQPQTMERYEIKYMRKQWLQTSIGYSNFNGVIFPVARVEARVVIRRNENVARGKW